jgi:formimidoylglutamate deiminase
VKGRHRAEATTQPEPAGVDRIFLDHALLPEGWAQDVLIEVADGFIQSIASGSTSDNARRLKGIALPGLPNIHSHAFQRAMAGLAETRGPDHDNFWTWREAMYRMLAVWTPDDVEAIAAFSQMEMLERGFTAVSEFHYLHHDESGTPYADLSEMCQRIVAAAETSGSD